ncbi:hypothetical protein [Catellatospora tritici]|uniref:hypothetical protein n=1 Tax=Catellatospora tritici TaxID=2851566 RepID=UPI001C2DD0ED|nr:hypothetical protein [Catellatospora tritici]MBV1848645.1 hypothetical protein [Catellatospora tritici]
MSPLPRLRWLALCFAVLALLLRAADAVWWAPRHGRQEIIGQFLPALIIFGLAIGGYVLLIRPYRELPRTFETTGTTFIAPAAPGAASTALIFGYLAGSGVDSVLKPDGTASDHPAAWIFGGAVVASLLALAVLSLWRGPQVVLGRDGLTIRGVRTRHLPWTALRRGGPGLPQATDVQLLLITATPAGTYRRERLRLVSLYVDGEFLARAIRHYAQHPEHRTAIGTDDELGRLTAALAAPVAAADAAPADAALGDLGGRA